MGEFSLTHWLIILAVLMLFFGPSRLPQLGQSLGKALRGFKEGLSEKEKEAQAEMKREETATMNERIANLKTEPTATRTANPQPTHEPTQML